MPTRSFQMATRKKILVHSNSHTAFTGFGKNCKNILKYLHKTGKYDLYELANGVVWSEDDKSLPWGFYGSLPNDQATLSILNSNQQVSKPVGYGLATIDKAIELIKPDIYLGIEDIWAFSETVNRPWWNKINCMIWTTLDSLPILPDAVNMAPQIKNYYVWSSFAEKAMKNIGIDHVKTLHGSIDEKNFFRGTDEQRLLIRAKNNIDKDAFVIGFVFRNQLRKTVSDLIIGFKIFKDQYPESNAKLLLHTNWGEGWDIPRLMNENSISANDVLTTYHCNHCKNYKVMPFVGNNLDCGICGAKGSVSTTSVTSGVSEMQLNEVYNIMDMYVHPFTSGGQEIPIQEAKLCELITAVTNYTCGEEMATEESGGLPLAWAPYREFGTQFIKASTSPIDISKKIQMVYEMEPLKKREIEKKARKYTIENYSFVSIGKKLEKIFDEMPEVSFDFSKTNIKPNPDYVPKEKYASDIEFIQDLFLNFLGVNADINHPDLIECVTRLRKGEKAPNMVNIFKMNAKNQLDKISPLKVEDFIDKEDKTPKIALVIPSDNYVAFICGFFIKSLKEKHPEHKLYVFIDSSLHEIIAPYLDYVEKICPLVQNCTNPSYMEGVGENAGFFDVCYIVDKESLILNSFSHNAKDGI